MERILITKRIEDMALEYLAILKSGKQGRFKSPIQKLDMLLTFLEGKGKAYQKYAVYVKRILDRYDEIVCLKPSDFDTYDKTWFNILKPQRLKLKFKYQKTRKSFCEHVVDALRYKWVREEVFLDFGLQLGVKTCAYCNAQYATTVLESNHNFATYDLDHYYPKSRYPFLATSFYNLVPVCSHCNRAKSDKEPTFCLYTTDVRKLRPLMFRLEPRSVIDYMLTHCTDNLNILIEAKNPSEKRILDKFVGDLGLDGLYKSHKDEAAELLWKAKIYNKAFRTQLKASFDRTVKFEDCEIDHIIYGFDLRHGKVHQKPLSLLGQDIYETYSRG